MENPVDVLAFGAHPDDVELGCGGTLVKLGEMGYKTGVIALTRGELGTRGSKQIREREFTEAAGILGLTGYKVLDIPDGDIVVNMENKLKVVREIRAFRPRVVFAQYWKDRHPDHAHASNLVREAAFFAGLKKIDTGQAPHRPDRVVYYAGRYEFKPSFVVDISGQHAKKVAAINAYKSQFHNPEKSKYGDDETNISNPEFLDAIVTRAKQYGAYLGVQFGEPFFVREPILLDDPVAVLSGCGERLL
jgi:bacillithiol biosynthesis deacetylase BshB1